jgi:hypothetical protein
MRHGITWMGAMFALCSFIASHAADAQESDPVAVTKSFLGAWATSSVDDLRKFMADDAVVVGSSGLKLTGEEDLRRFLGAIKGLQNRDYEVRKVGDRLTAHGKTYGFVPYVELGIEPGEWDSLIEVKNGHRVLRVVLHAGIQRKASASLSSKTRLCHRGQALPGFRSACKGTHRECAAQIVLWPV